jgi:site-specific DNA recombinase
MPRSHRSDIVFGTHKITQDPGPRTAAPATPGEDTRVLIADCDARLTRYQAALDAGADPQAVAEWTRQVKAERAAALARDASRNRHPPVRQLTEDDIRALITGLGDLRDIIRDAEPPVKAAVYNQLGLQVTYLPGQEKLRAT